LAKRIVDLDTNTKIGDEPRIPAPDFTPFRDLLKTGGQGPEMVSLKNTPLTFNMGSPKDEKGRWNHDDREGSVHLVNLSAFSIGKYPITVNQFRLFIDESGYRTDAERGEGAVVYHEKVWSQKRDANWKNPYFEQNEDHPVVCISWNDARAYCDWISQQTQEEYRLLTEAEWEYACRSGSETRYFFGDDDKSLAKFSWYSENSNDKTHPINLRKPNQFGLHETHGNIWEWVNDWYDKEYYKHSPVENPRGPGESSYRAFRGCSWHNASEDCRSAFRRGRRPSFCDATLGFRLARTNPDPAYPLSPDNVPHEKLCDFLSDGKTPASPMSWVPDGSFLMGSQDNEDKRNSDEGPCHSVKLKGFSVGQHPVTVGQFHRFVKATGYKTETEDIGNSNWNKKSKVYWADPGFVQTDYHPVVCLSWNDAKAYCNWVSDETGEHYHLLTEAQWEYACRAGSITTYHFDNEASKLEDYAWYSKNSANQTNPVCRKKGNKWGLYDVYGNVWERVVVQRFPDPSEAKPDE